MSAITVEQAKQFLQIGHSEQDAILTLLLEGLDDTVERLCNIKLSDADYEELVDGGGYGLRVENLPLNSVSSVEGAESGSSESFKVVRSAIYRTDETERWTSGYHRYKVTYNGGYASVPPGLKIVMLQLLDRFYNNRGGLVQQSVAGYTTEWQAFLDDRGDLQALLSPFKKGTKIG